MKNLFYLLVFTFSFTIVIDAQPAVAICGWDGNSGDKFSFVLLRDFAAGEVVYFTEDEYVNTTGTFNSSEGHVAYTVPAGGLLSNEVISITESSSQTFTVGCAGGSAAIVGTGSWSFSNADELYAYSASSPGSPWSSVTEVHCFAWFSNTNFLATQDPSGDWPGAIIVAFNIGGGSGVNADFLDAFRVEPTIPIFTNGANWLQSSGSITLSCTDFTNHMLPIELMSFDARLKDRKVLLEWETASEINNERFEVEHSTDGRNFTVVGTIRGKGTSYVTNSYELMHHFPYNGVNYYRLKQIDYDGAFSYSQIKAVNLRSSDKAIASAFPNPFDQTLTIQVPQVENSGAGEMRKIEIYDVYGKLAKRINVPMDENIITLDLSSLSSGAYFLHTLDGNTQLTDMQRIIKI